jgi:hypothetical protein
MLACRGRSCRIQNGSARQAFTCFVGHRGRIPAGLRHASHAHRNRRSEGAGRGSADHARAGADAPAPLGPRPSSLSAAADALFAQVCKLEAYVLRADPLLRVSAGEKPAELPKYPECEGR